MEFLKYNLQIILESTFFVITSSYKAEEVKSLNYY